MSEASFDQFLADALRPPERGEDYLFARRVLEKVAMEQRLKEQRQAIARRFAFDLLALASIAAALIAISMAPALQSIPTEQLPVVLLATLVCVGAWLWISNLSAPRFALGGSVS